LLLLPEDAVREMLRDFSLSRGLPEVGTVTAADQLDDGSPIALAITIDRCDARFCSTGFKVQGCSRFNSTAALAITSHRCKAELPALHVLAFVCGFSIFVDYVAP
jgi:hypothetical protein